MGRRHEGELAQRLREAAGLTRNELATAAGRAPATIRNFETGRHIPTNQTLRRLLAHPALARLCTFLGSGHLNNVQNFE